MGGKECESGKTFMDFRQDNQTFLVFFLALQASRLVDGVKQSDTYSKETNRFSTRWTVLLISNWKSLDSNPDWIEIINN